MMGYSDGSGLIMLLLMLLFWGGLIGLAVWGAKAAFSNGSKKHLSGRHLRSEEDPLEILAQRYAQGEITREQYDVIKQDLA